MAEDQLKECSLFTKQVGGKGLDEVIEAFFAVSENKDAEETFAIFYTPQECLLGKYNGNNFEVKEKKLELERVFEVRIFNEIAELRWLNEPDGNHLTAILSEKQLIFDGKELQAESKILGGICHKYLLWGRSIETNPHIWTRLAEARIRAFYVPIEVRRNDKDDRSGYAQFTAVEYLKQYEDGNVAVFDERLTGIKIYAEDKLKQK